eukprot:1144884-Pelagomonas_calceolata.AAC.6
MAATLSIAFQPRCLRSRSFEAVALSTGCCRVEAWSGSPAGRRRIRQFTSEHHLTDRPHTMLWLTKIYALPASMYADQVWGTRYMKEGAEMDDPLQTVHLCLLKRILGQLGFTMLYHAASALQPVSLGGL